MISLCRTLGAAGASVLMGDRTKGLSALGTFLEAGGADNMQLVIADKIPAPRVETGFAGQGVPFSKQGIIRQGERSGRKGLFNAKTKPADVLTPAQRKDKI